ncbi:head decoration protein [Caloramator sp. CAR-1]|uniref:head decoration protein n=1 Tax=Caloramator sp. CAR-1 TaxID=3062777 RepID=UPI0026E16F1C|nr:head decoration protein [Caloramator sp. CAR-1]MDO6355288.1 head decoration protein [Caloramator sp. CAR-1]
MAENLYSKIEEVRSDNLIADSIVPVLVKGITLEKGQGVLKRGTVLGIVTATGLAKVVDSSKTDGTENADCILADDVDTGDGSATTDFPAQAYISGCFNRNALIFGGTDTVEKHETRLRELGIFLKDNIAY